MMRKSTGRFFLLVFCTISFILLLLTLGIYLRGRGPHDQVRLQSKKRVWISKTNKGYQLMRNGQPFFIKGAAGYDKCHELAASGGNTLMCWDTARLQSALDSAAQTGVAIIAGIYLPPVSEEAFYADSFLVQQYLVSYQHFVERFRAHPALLAWSLGNELDFAFSVGTPPFYAVYRHFLEMLHRTDSSHPVCTTVINAGKKNILSLQWRFPELDFIGINTYDRLKGFRKDMQFLHTFWNGPYFISEWAPQGPWEAEFTSWGAPVEKNSSQKAVDYARYYREFMPLEDSCFLGSLAFFWGSRQEYTYTWFSIIDDNGYSTEIREALEDVWRDTSTVHQAPGLGDLRIDSFTHGDHNIFLDNGSWHTAYIEVHGHSEPGVRYSWQITREDWTTWGQTWQGFRPPLPEKNLITDTTAASIRFQAPLPEGPYRLYVSVYSAGGYCATANAPVYVIGKPVSR